MLYCFNASDDLANGLYCGDGIPIYDAALVQISNSRTIPANVKCVIGFMSQNHKMLAVVKDFSTEGTYKGKCERNHLDIYNGIYKNITAHPDKKITGIT